MPAIARIGDRVTGICKQPGHPVRLYFGTIIGGSDDTFNNKGVARKGDTVLINCPRAHTTTIMTGSDKVFVNGIPVARRSDLVGKEDKTDYEGFISSASQNVNAG